MPSNDIDDLDYFESEEHMALETQLCTAVSPDDLAEAMEAARMALAAGRISQATFERLRALVSHDLSVWTVQ